MYVAHVLTCVTENIGDPWGDPSCSHAYNAQIVKLELVNNLKKYS